MEFEPGSSEGNLRKRPVMEWSQTTGETSQEHLSAFRIRSKLPVGLYQSLDITRHRRVVFSEPGDALDLAAAHRGMGNSSTVEDLRL